ncbi:MAG: hypothetical protein DRJ65_08460 [Acidobacteria bacterium]|nr:MAG: hypothetical protein DRJ65_08460 [Acidobacteriota bacterium]
MISISISVLALLLALFLRTGRAPTMKPLALPLLLTACAAMGTALTDVLSAGDPWDSWARMTLVAAVGILSARAGLLVFFDWALERRMGITAPQLIRDVTALIVYLTLTVVLLRTMGVEVTGLIATSAVLTVVIGLAFQQTLGNLLAGLALAWEQRLPDGSWIEIEGQVAQIEESGWRSMLVRTRLGDRVLIPNADVAAARVALLSGGGRPVAVPVRLGLSYGVPPDMAKEVLFGVGLDTPDVLQDPPPTILTTEFADSSVMYECRLWTRVPWYRVNITDAFLTRAHAALARDGMEIPFPQRTLHRPRPRQDPDSQARRLEHLGRAWLFSGIPVSALETVAEHTRILRFAPGEAVVREGDVSDALFLVVSGEAVIRVGARDVSKIHPTEIFGEGAFLTGNPRAATVRAAKHPLEVIQISKAALGTLLEQHPELTDKLAQRFAERQLEGETILDESGAIVSPQGLVAQLRRTLSRLVGG